jgi:Putative adhesin
MHPARCPKLSALVAGFCAAGVLSGCDVTIKDGDIKGVSVRAKATREWTRRYPLAPGGRVEIVNNNGRIEAVAGPAGAIDIEAVLEAQAMTQARAEEMVEQAKVEESVDPSHVRLAIARAGGRRGLDATFKVRLPPDAVLEMSGANGTLRATGLSGHVKAMIVNGGVELTGMSGTIDAASVNGHVTTKMSQITGPVRLESTNGRIALQIPKSARATLNARSVNGSINVTGLTVEDGSGRRIRTLESQLNGGGPNIDLRVTNGRINITGTDETPESPPIPSR